MQVLDGLFYTKDHEWIRVEGDTAFLGITDYAQLGLGDIVYAELPKVGALLKVGDAFAVVESVKAASDIYTPVSGAVSATNEDIERSPEKLNEAPYESWMIQVILSDVEELKGLMDSDTYKKWCIQEG